MTMFWEKFIDLCNQKDVNPDTVCADLGFTFTTVMYWKSGAKPNADTLRKISEYFGVSIDYLLGYDLIEDCEDPKDRDKYTFWYKLRRLQRNENTDLIEFLKSYGIKPSSMLMYKAFPLPDSQTIQRLADHFGVTTDYLLGIDPTDNPDRSLSEPVETYLNAKERYILSLYRKCSLEQRKKATAYLESLVEKKFR